MHQNIATFIIINVDKVKQQKWKTCTKPNQQRKSRRILEILNLKKIMSSFESIQ